MPCANARDAWLAVDGGAITFREDLGIPDTKFPLPCGKCRLCLNRRAREWAQRLNAEAKMHEESCCLTLTYDDENLPADRELSKTEVKLFMKRLRFHLWKRFKIRFRFYICGEYGTKTGRPHYHAIIFGCAFLFDRKKSTGPMNPYAKYKSEFLDKIWGKGFVEIGTMGPGAAKYVTKYLCKGISPTDTEQGSWIYPTQAPKRKVQQLPFHHQSTNPGIGFMHYKTYKNELFLSDSFMVKTPYGCIKMPIPAYYSRKFKEEEPDSYEFIRDKRVKAAKKNPLTKQQLEAKEYILNQRKLRDAGRI